MKKIFVLLLAYTSLVCKSQTIFRSNKIETNTAVEYYINLFKKTNKNLIDSSNVLENKSSVKLIYKFINKEFKINLIQQKVLQTNWSSFNIYNKNNDKFKIHLFFIEMIFSNQNDCNKVFEILKLHKSKRFKGFILTEFIVFKKEENIYLFFSETPRYNEIRSYFKTLGE